MNEIYFVIAESPFIFEGQSTFVVKTDNAISQDVIEAARRSGVNTIYIAKATEILSRTVTYKSKPLSE